MFSKLVPKLCPNCGSGGFFNRAEFVGLNDGNWAEADMGHLDVTVNKD